MLQFEATRALRMARARGKLVVAVAAVLRKHVSLLLQRDDWLLDGCVRWI